jgi:hypothetical protein
VDAARDEMVEKELDALITRRHDPRVSGEGHRPSEEMYEESTRRYQEQVRAQARAEWHLHHMGQAERLRRSLEILIAFHEAEAERCLPKGA